MFLARTAEVEAAKGLLDISKSRLQQVTFAFLRWGFGTVLGQQMADSGSKLRKFGRPPPNLVLTPRATISE